MRSLALALPLVVLPSLTMAQDTGLALNMGRGLDNGMSVNWTFKENWTLRPTIGAGYSQQTGFQVSLGSTVLRSFGFGHRVYGYVGAGVYYGSANRGRNSSFGGQGQGGRGVGGNQGNPFDPLLTQNAGNIGYVTTPVGLRGRLYGNFEAFAEAAYQRTLSGQFGLSQTGQFSGNSAERFGATFGISLRLQ
ncbi:MAG: hypothetical protein JJE39_17875 [Vicinamibacteria bacterium]|nr:hypothetical protein [Vicinamibacteria bacterium]